MKKTLLLFIFSVFTIFLKGQNPNEIDSLLKVLKTQKDTSKIKTIREISKLYNRKGIRDSALYYLNSGLLFAEQYGSKKQICSMLLGIGETKSRLSKYDDALINLFSILKLAEKEDCGEFAGRAKKEIGAIYIYQKREKEALRYLFEAESELKKMKDTLGLFQVYGNLPVCIALTGDTSKAMQYFKRCFDIIDRYALGDYSNNRREVIIINKMSCTFNMVNFTNAKEDLTIALREMEEIQKEVDAGTNVFRKFSLYTVLSDIHLRLKQYEKAQHYGELALKAFKVNKDYTELMNVHWNIAVASASLKQYEKAYDNLILNIQYGDSVFNTSKIEAVNSVEAKYQVEKKEQEIITLNKEKKSQKIIVGLTIGSLLFVLGLLVFVIRSKKLQKKLLLKEKEIQKKELEQKMAVLEQTALRAQMNPHFIFNCLNSINRFIVSNDAEGANHYLSTFANLIRQTLENSGKQLIPLKDEIKYLETYIKMEHLRSNNSFEYNISVSPDVDQSNTYIPNMIIQPFAENSVHHGMLNTAGGKGMIRMNFSMNNKLVCTIDDNGPGIKSSSSRMHNENEEHTSMGSGITEKRIHIYNSIHEDKIELEITDKSDTGIAESGTRVILKFPLNN